MAAEVTPTGRLVLVLSVICLASGALLVGTDQFTRPRIAANQALKTQRALLGVLPAGTVRTDQDPRPGEASGSSHPFVLDFSDEWAAHGTDLARFLDAEQEKVKATRVYRGYDQQGKVTGWALLCELPDGYSGNIRFILGLRHDPAIQGFRVAGSRILSHKETPGLGANLVSVEYEESVKAAKEGRDPVPFFLARFVGRGYEEVGLAKDGHPARIEALTAATITSRAFTRAVQQILSACNRNRNDLLEPPPEAIQAGGAPATGEGRG